MKSRTQVGGFRVVLGASLAALVLSSSAFAQHGGGGGGGHGGGGGGGGGGHAAVGGHGGYGGGYRGGYGGGYRGGYGGYRGGYGYGWRGGYYGGWRGGWGWGCCGWGWGWGLGLGLYFATLPLYYSTYYWDGVPYYYADNTYYTYDPNVRQYVTVAPPQGLIAQGGGPDPATGGSSDLIAYPKNGQSTEQQGKDKFECHQWAASQSGYDPTLGAQEAAAANKRSDYMRAQAACLEGRGYSVQ